MGPDGPLQRLGPHLAPRAGRRSCAEDAVLAAAGVVTLLRFGGRRPVGTGVHGQPAELAGEQAAQEVIVPGVVAEAEGSVAGELRLRAVPCLLLDDRRHRNGDPLIPGLQLAARAFTTALAPHAGFLRRDILVAVRVGGAGVAWIREDLVHNRGRPGPPAGAREPRAEIQALEDLADGHLLLDKPAVDHAHHCGLALVDHEVPRHALLSRYVAVAVGSFSADVLASTRLLKLAAAEALAQECPLVLRYGALDLQEELVTGVL
jgi:hypothetical protein